MMRAIVAASVVSIAFFSASASAQESPKTKGISCYELGVKYAKCAMTVATGLAPRCPSEFDFLKPARCAKDSSFDKGVRAGTEEFERLVRKYSE